MDPAIAESYLAAMRGLCAAGMMVVCVIAGRTHSQVSVQTVPPQFGLNATSQHHADAFTMLAHPSSLPVRPAVAFQVYGERKYGFKEAGQYVIGMAYAREEDGFAAGLLYGGSTIYNETEFRVAYGRRLAGRLAAGAEIHFVSVGMDGYGKVSVPGFGFGLLLGLSENFRAGLRMRDVISAVPREKSRIRLPASYSFLLGFEPSRQILIGFAFHQEEEQTPEAQLRMQYCPLDQIRLGAGFAILNQTISFSGGWVNKKGKRQLAVDIHSSWHFLLGFSGGLQLGFSFLKNEE